MSRRRGPKAEFEFADPFVWRASPGAGAAASYAREQQAIRENRNRLVNDLIAEIGPPTAEEAQVIDALFPSEQPQLCVGRQISWVVEEKVVDFVEISKNIPHTGADGWRQITHRCMSKVTRRCEVCGAPVCGKHSIITHRNPRPRCPAHRA